jgi:hypothetical protein
MEGVSGSIPLPPTSEKPNNQGHFCIVAKMPNGSSQQNVA